MATNTENTANLVLDIDSVSFTAYLTIKEPRKTSERNNTYAHRVILSVEELARLAPKGWILAYHKESGQPTYKVEGDTVTFTLDMIPEDVELLKKENKANSESATFYKDCYAHQCQKTDIHGRSMWFAGLLTGAAVAITAMAVALSNKD